MPSKETLRDLVRQACRAPSIHNTQPWRWIADDDELRLVSDTRRRLTYADPTGRDLVLSCGTALNHLVVAAASSGWAATVRRVPDAQNPELLASLTFREHPASPEDLKRARAMLDRRTDRRQVSSWPVPAGRVEQLVRLALEQGVVAAALDEGVRDELMERLVVAAQAEQHRNDRFLDELLGWTHAAGRQGVPTSNMLTRQAAARAGAPTRFPAGSLADDYQEEAEPDPTWLVLSTSSDDVASWLRAGEALAAVWLACSASGLSLVPFTQPIEVPATRQLLQDKVLGGTACPQVLMRIGWPPLGQDPVDATQRLPVDDVLVFERSTSSD